MAPGPNLHSRKIGRKTNKAYVIETCMEDTLNYAELRDKAIWELSDCEFNYVVKTLLYLAKPLG